MTSDVKERGDPVSKVSIGSQPMRTFMDGMPFVTTSLIGRRGQVKEKEELVVRTADKYLLIT